MILSIVAIVVCIALLIACHEIGHLIAAKLAGVGVETFSIGFGPAILKKKIGETTYVLSLIPVGGYIKMVGEDFESEGFYTQSLGKKLAVGLSGSFANFILAFVITFLVVLIYGQLMLKPAVTAKPGFDAARAGVMTKDLILAINQQPVTSFEQLEKVLSTNEGKQISIRLRRQDQILETSITVRRDSLGLSPWVPPVVGEIKTGGPASKVGLKPGDEIVELAGREISSWQELVDTVQVSAGETLSIRWRRGSELLSGTVVPAPTPTEGKPIGQIGVQVKTERQPVNFFRAVGGSAVRTVEMTVQTCVIFYKVIIGKISRRALGGPILMAQLSSESIRWGWDYFFSLLALLSINLFIINLLPIPALDGGRVLIFLIEAVRRRRFSKKEWTIALQAGWALIILIFVFVTFNDIVRIVKR